MNDCVLLEVTNAKRIGVVIQGFTVSHVHPHLIPMHDAHDLDIARAKPALESDLKHMAVKIIQAISSKP